MTINDCATAKSAIKARDFGGWMGLPAACSAQDLFDDFPFDLSDRPLRWLGDDSRRATFVLLSLEGYYRPMASFRDGKLVLFDAMNPSLAGGFEGLRDDLGTPAARLDWDYGTLAIPGGEWAFPGRGITLFVNTDANRVLHIALYNPTTLTQYRKTLRPHLKKEPLPSRTNRS